MRSAASIQILRALTNMPGAGLAAATMMQLAVLVAVALISAAPGYTAASDPLVPFPAPRSLGPFLRFSNYNPLTNNYAATVLVGYQQRKGPKPMLYIRPGRKGKYNKVQGVDLDTVQYAGATYQFTRFPLQMQLGSSETQYQYYLKSSLLKNKNVTVKYTFTVPAQGQTWHWMYFSCNGFHNPADGPTIGGVAPVWRDVFATHAAKPLHLMVGDGDQLYNDNVLTQPAIVSWLNLAQGDAPDYRPLATASMNADMTAQATAWYFGHYMYHWNEDKFRQALASIPHTFQWDDHETWDGFGSHPVALESSSVYKGLAAIARRFYLLFQHHSTDAMLMPDLTAFGTGHLTWGSALGPDTVLVSLDTRSERNRSQIISQGQYAAIQNLVGVMPPSVKHLVVTSSVPLIYPAGAASDPILAAFHLPSWEVFEAALLDPTTFAQIQAALKAQGLGSVLELSPFHSLALLTNIIDGWDCPNHLPERALMLLAFQAFAQAKGIRITFLVGDSHLAYVGAFHTNGTSLSDTASLRHDPCYMVQAGSSPIANQPATDVLMVLEAAMGAPEPAAPNTLASLYQGYWSGVLHDLPSGYQYSLAPRRNWLEVSSNMTTGELSLTHHLEAYMVSGKEVAWCATCGIKDYVKKTFVVPPLVLA